MRFAGIDAGTKTYDIFWFDDELITCYLNQHGENFGHITLPSVKVKKNPNLILEALKEVNAEVYAGLSGYGLPVKHFSEINDREFKLMTLSLEKEAAMGLREVINLLMKSDLNIYTIPAIIHLKTIPEFRKFCRIDMGTYDKLCTAVTSLLKSKTHIVIEAGYGYNAFIALENSKIVDGIGGTSGFPSYNSIGCIDAELAYLLGSFPKKIINFGLKSTKFWEVGLVENILKGLRAVEVSLIASLKSQESNKSKSCNLKFFNSKFKVFLSGRVFSDTEFLAVCKKIKEELRELGYEFENLNDILCINSPSAVGASLIANGIGKGKYASLIKNAGILDANGEILDYLPAELRNIVENRLFK